MMRMNNIKMNVTVPREELLLKVRKNFEQHRQIVKEAHAGYIEKAKVALCERLDALKAGRAETLHFSLIPPTDHSDVYRAVIAMLEWTKDNTVQLAPDEFRQIVLDEWEWRDSFLSNSQKYSNTASMLYNLGNRVEPGDLEA